MDDVSNEDTQPIHIAPVESCKPPAHIWADGARTCLCGRFTLGAAALAGRGVKVEDRRELEHAETQDEGPLVGGRLEEHLRMLKRRFVHLDDRIAGLESIGRAPSGYDRAERNALRWAMDALEAEAGGRVLYSVLKQLGSNGSPNLHRAINGITELENADRWLRVVRGASDELLRARSRLMNIAAKLKETTPEVVK